MRGGGWKWIRYGGLFNLAVDPGENHDLRRDEAAQLGVDRAAVVALVVVLTQHFPVRVDGIPDAVRDAQLAERVALEALGRAGDELVEGGRVAVEVDEDDLEDDLVADVDDIDDDDEDDDEDDDLI